MKEIPKKRSEIIEDIIKQRYNTTTQSPNPISVSEIGIDVLQKKKTPLLTAQEKLRYLGQFKPMSLFMKQGPGIHLILDYPVYSDLMSEEHNLLLPRVVYINSTVTRTGYTAHISDIVGI